jgi:hypothetical protein
MVRLRVPMVTMRSQHTFSMVSPNAPYIVSRIPLIAPLGTGVAVYTTIGTIEGTGAFVFSIDDVQDGTFNPINLDPQRGGRHVLAYSSPSLDDGSHTLTITRSGDVHPALWLDYFLCNMTIHADSNMDGLTQFFDDKSPEIRYSDGWNAVDLSEVPVDSRSVMNTAETSMGGNVSFSFDFQGKSVTFSEALTNAYFAFSSRAFGLDVRPPS